MALLLAKQPLVESLPYAASAADWLSRLRHLPQAVLLASGSSSHQAARFDIITADPVAVLRTRNGATVVTEKGGKVIETSHDDPFLVLGRHCPLQPGSALPDLPFTGGAIAWFGYELLHHANRILPHHPHGLGLPDMMAGLYDWAIIIDHQQQKSTLVMSCTTDQRRDQLRVALQAPATASDGFRLTQPFTSNFSRQEYLNRFRRVIDYIHAGDCYQVNLAQCFTAVCAGDGFTAFQHLQQRANAPFAAFLQDGRFEVLSFSPERFLKVDNCLVTTQPIKGTRPRSSDPSQDVRNRVELETSEKDRAENLMIVDLLRNDLGRVCMFGSVQVEKLFELQSFTNVHHLVSTITGKLEQPADVFRLMSACFPGGSITGTPKLRTMQIINELETMPRSVYCGVIGWIDRSGNMDSNIAIRTLVRDGEHLHCWGGGGVVADSDGDAEYQETLDKISMLIHNL